MHLEPLKQWICDSCRTLIESAETGWLEWYKDDADDRNEGFRIVHHQGNCQYDEMALHRQKKRTQDNHLTYFTGTDGFIILLQMFDYEKIADPLELTTIIRRLHLPYYEEARQYWDQAQQDGLVSGERHDVTDYFKDTLQSIIRRYGEGEAPAVTTYEGIH